MLNENKIWIKALKLMLGPEEQATQNLVLRPELAHPQLYHGPYNDSAGSSQVKLSKACPQDSRIHLFD
jgi:hypothetical protein